MHIEKYHIIILTNFLTQLAGGFGVERDDWQEKTVVSI
jgi:hypothetical protein